MRHIGTHVFYKVRSVGFLLCLAALCEAKVTLPPLISDGMVLQRGQELTIWGEADPGEEVKVIFRKESYLTYADTAGRWEVVLPAQQAGGPYTLRIQEIGLADIWIGDVFLCSGQSNMELPVSRVMERFREEVEHDSDVPAVRYFHVPMQFGFDAPQQQTGAAFWRALTPENVSSFSALCYFLGKELWRASGVPVGIINSSVGGSPAEAWISEEGLLPFPTYLRERDLVRDEAYVQAIRAQESISSRLWNELLHAHDPGLNGQEHGYHPAFDDRDWQEVNVFSGDWATDGVTPRNGSHWFRQTVDIPDTYSGQEAILRLGCLVDADSVFVNGTFVGSTGYQYPPRIYPLPAGLLRSGSNQVTVRLISYSGQPSFVADKPYQIVWDGTEIPLSPVWRYHRGAEMPAAGGQTFFRYKPTGLYNGMIAPLHRYRIAGVVWYQGESNSGRYMDYDRLLSALIADWRGLWQQPELPFFVIQLPNFQPALPAPSESQWAEMRARQAKVAREIPRTALVVTYDTGEWNDIHPLDKKTIAQRLSLQIRKAVQGATDVVAEGPVYASREIRGGEVLLSFREEGGDLQPDDDLKGFAVAGADGRYHWAKARTEEDRVVVWSAEVPVPVRVRYAWADNPEGASLRNRQGLPAAPFQTD